MTHRFSRTEQLIGKEALAKLKHARVAVFGLGAVGSYAVEALARAAVRSAVYLILPEYLVCLRLTK